MLELHQKQIEQLEVNIFLGCHLFGQISTLILDQKPEAGRKIERC
jgi:hypothetical protein